MLYETALKIADSQHEINVIVTSKSMPEYTKTEKDFESLAKKLQVPYFLTFKIDKPELNSLLKGSDISVSFNWVSIITKEQINYFKIGILNAHFGDLPKYRGNACPNWAILNGEKEIAVSVHLMEGGKLDCGRVIAQEKMLLSNDAYIEDIYHWGEKIIPDLFLKAVSILENKPDYALKYADADSPDSPDSLRCYPRKPEDGRINLNKSADDIHRLIRASGKPFRGAYCFLGDKELTIWRAELYKDNEQYLAVPGQICEIGHDYFIIITGDGKLKITEWECSEKIKSIRQRLT